MKTQLEICKNCTKAKRDIKLGLICGITGKKPDLEQTCNLFEPTKEYLDYIEERKPEITTTTRWKCAQCGEINEESFEICWNCQTERSETDEIIEEKQIGKSKREEHIEKEVQKGSIGRFVVSSFMTASWVAGFVSLFKYDDPEIIFLFLFIYNFLYLIYYFTFSQEVRNELGFSLFEKGIAVNILLLISYFIALIFK